MMAGFHAAFAETSSANRKGKGHHAPVFPEAQLLHAQSAVLASHVFQRGRFPPLASRFESKGGFRDHGA